MLKFISTASDLRRAGLFVTYLAARNKWFVFGSVKGSQSRPKLPPPWASFTTALSVRQPSDQGITAAIDQTAFSKTQLDRQPPTRSQQRKLRKVNRLFGEPVCVSRRPLSSPSSGAEKPILLEPRHSSYIT